MSDDTDRIFNEMDVVAHQGVDTSVKDTIVFEDGRPDMGSPEWSDWVLSLLTDKEMIDIGGKQYPVSAGLRRIAKIVLEPIWGCVIFSAPVQSVSIGDLRSMAQWELRFQNGMTFGDVADCTEFNTDDTFLAFSTSTAATRAESRCYRKALGIATVAAEEMTSKDTAAETRRHRDNAKYENVTTGERSSGGTEKNVGSLPSERQVGYLSSLIRELDLNADEVLSLFDVDDVYNPEQFHKGTVSTILDKLVEFRNDPGEVPGKIKGYNNWSIDYDAIKRNFEN